MEIRKTVFALSLLILLFNGTTVFASESDEEFDAVFSGNVVVGTKTYFTHIYGPETTNYSEKCISCQEAFYPADRTVYYSDVFQSWKSHDVGITYLNVSKITSNKVASVLGVNTENLSQVYSTATAELVHECGIGYSKTSTAWCMGDHGHGHKYTKAWSEPHNYTYPGNQLIDLSSVELKNLTVSGPTLKLPATSNARVVIDGGSYQGSPAVTGAGIIVKRGTFTDLIGNSLFIVDADSEATVTTSGDKTITTVKLSNPPVIIDWGDFPGLDLGADNHDYVIPKIFASVAV